MDIKNLVNIISDISSETDISECAQHLANEIRKESHSKSSSVYIYDRYKSSYKLYASAGSSKLTDLIAIEEVDELIFDQNCERSFRGDFMCGFCIFDNTNHFDKDNSIKALSSLIAILYNRLFSISIFTNMHVPIKLNDSAHEYRRSLLNIAQKSSAVPYSVHFAKTEEGWTQKYFWNNYSHEYQDSIRSEKISDMDSISYLNSLSDHTFSILNKSEISQNPLLNTTKLSGLSSGVLCKSKLGEDGFIVILYGFPVKYTFSTLELNGYMSLTNAIGISASNYLSIHKDKEEQIHEQQMDELSGTLELIRIVRHDLAANLDAVTFSLITLKGISQKRKNIDSTDISEKLTKLMSVVDASKKIVASIKTLMYEPEFKEEDINLNDFRDSILSSFGGRGECNNVSFNISEMDHVILADKARLRQIFNNLILNSLEAFKSNRNRLPKHNRKFIDISVFEVKKNESITLRYSDNAGGIIKNEIFSAAKKANCDTEDISQLVFEKRVTTKSKGSGNGMHISRVLSEKLNGSLILVSFNHGGIIFDLKLPIGK
ncbi:MAG: ATP-binding protein [Arenicella sp.]